MTSTEHHTLTELVAQFRRRAARMANLAENPPDVVKVFGSAYAKGEAYAWGAAADDLESVLTEADHA